VKQKRGDKWVVLTEDGSRVLGEHDTEAEADAQLTAIHLNKARKRGVRVPLPKPIKRP